MPGECDAGERDAERPGWEGLTSLDVMRLELAFPQPYEMGAGRIPGH